MIRATVFAVVLCVTGALGVVLRVPDDYPTIQSAMNALGDEDTIVVALGTYAEALIAPPLCFYLLADVIADTGDYPRPVIDPAPMPGSDSLACLTLPANSRVTIERFRFENGAPMYPRAGPDHHPGGIVYFTSDSLTLRECAFDSVYEGITWGVATARVRLTVDHCTFQNMTGACIASKGPLTMADCEIRGRNFGGVTARDSSRIERCHFQGEMELGWLGVYRNNNVIRDCVFGPGVCESFGPLDIWDWGNNRVAKSYFINIGLSGYLMRILIQEGPLLQVDSCEFVGNFLHQLQHSPILIQDNPDSANPEAPIMFRDNSFVFNSTAQEGLDLAKLLEISTRVSATQCERNRFISNCPVSAPVFQIDTLGSLHEIHENVFAGNSYAIHNSWQAVNAIHNYWGDATGPFHPASNPNGLGDEVSDNVLFDPWYPDTSFLNASRPRAPLPESVSLEVYPNPFNATATLKLFVNEPGIFRVDLYNLLGRHVEEIWSGAVAREKRIAFDGSGIASGLYFVRVYQPIGNHVVTLQKLVIAK